MTTFYRLVFFAEIFLCSLGNAQQIPLSKKLESIPESATLQTLVSLFGKNFQIKREAWINNPAYELLYPSQGFGLLIRANESKKLGFVGLYIYPAKYPDKTIHSIPIEALKTLQKARLNKIILSDFTLEDLGQFVRPIVSTLNLYKDKLSLEFHMPVISAIQYPCSCEDYVSQGEWNCPFYIRTDDKGDYDRITNRFAGDRTNRNPGESDNKRLAKTQSLINVERVLIQVQETKPLYIEELREKR